MNLVVSGNHSIKQLEQWVQEKFDSIKNKEVKLPDLSYPKMPFTPENLGVLVCFKPVQDKDTLEIKWILPYCEKEFRSKPLRYFSYLFGHGGQNSLISYLKEEGLAMALTAKDDHHLEVFSEFCIEIVLTTKGRH